MFVWFFFCPLLGTLSVSVLSLRPVQWVIESHSLLSFCVSLSNLAGVEGQIEGNVSRSAFCQGKQRRANGFNLGLILKQIASPVWHWSCSVLSKPSKSDWVLFVCFNFYFPPFRDGSRGRHWQVIAPLIIGSSLSSNFCWFPGNRSEPRIVRHVTHHKA